MKRKKLELAITVAVYLMTAFLSSATALFFLRMFSKLTKEFRTGSMWINAVLPVVIAECLAMVLSLYNGQYGFEKQSFFKYFGKAVKGTVYFVGVWAAILLIQKNSITQSRHFFVATTGLHFVILMILLYLIQRMIIANFYKTGAATLVAIIVSRKDAQRASEILKSDWSRKIVGIMLREERPESVGAEEIDHIPVIGYGKDIVECVRKSAITKFLFLILMRILD